MPMVLMLRNPALWKSGYRFMVLLFLQLFCRFEIFKIKNWECVWENHVGLPST